MLTAANTRDRARNMTPTEIRAVIAYLNQQRYTAAVARHRAILVSELAARNLMQGGTK